MGVVWTLTTPWEASLKKAHYLCIGFGDWLIFGVRDSAEQWPGSLGFFGGGVEDRWWQGLVSWADNRVPLPLNLMHTIWHQPHTTINLTSNSGGVGLSLVSAGEWQACLWRSEQTETALSRVWQNTDVLKIPHQICSSRLLELWYAFKTWLIFKGWGAVCN